MILRPLGEHGTENAGSCSGPNGEAHDVALVHAHEALAFLGAVKMLELSAFEMSIAIGAAEIWASGEHPTDVRVARILSAPVNQYGVVGIVLARLRQLRPAWAPEEQRT